MPIVFEKRKFKRLPAGAPIRITLGSESLEGRAVDLSGSGVSFRVDRAIPVGVDIDVEIKSPSPSVLPTVLEPLRRKARVVRVEEQQERDKTVFEVAAEFV